MKHNTQPTTTEDSREGLHTQGEWKKSILPKRNSIGKPQTTIFVNNVGNVQTLIAMVWGNSIEQCEANAELICNAVNERQKLLNSNRELLEALTELHNMVQMANIEKTDRMYNSIIQAQTAINNSKNI